LETLKSVPAPKVEAAYYLIPKTKERGKGFFLKSKPSLLFIEPSSRSHSWITEEKKQELLLSSIETLAEVSLKIQQGELAPDPKHIEVCDACRWRNLCRAPHLI